MDTPMGNAYVQQHSRYPLSTSSHDSSSVSSAGSVQTLLPPPNSLYPPSNSRKLPDPLIQPSTSARSPVGFGSSEMRYHPYAASSNSPSSAGGPMPESSDSYLGSAISPTHLSGSNLGPNKRPYRQRRKDPSCDACRERKVKCDATETSSCSECSSRGVKCQFTKETNRRMSSIKQVQELQNQLTEARQQINHLKSLLDSNQDPTRAHQQPIHLPPLDPQVARDKDQRHPAVPHFDHVRRNLRKYSRGVFKIPAIHCSGMVTPLLSGEEPLVPPTDLVEALLRIYHDQIQRQAPMIHWPSFIQQWEKVRDARSFAGVPQIWAGLFYSVLACGTLQPSSPINPDVEGMTFIVRTTRLLNTWTDNIVPDHARCALLISIFLYELNIRSASWVWLGTAVRMAQELSLESEVGPWPALEIEGRRRTYWAIVSWDRLLSLQENKPFQVDIGESDGGWPTKVEDHWLQPSGNLRPPENVPGFSTVGIVVAVIRFIGQLKQSLKAEVITRETIQTYDLYFREIQGSFPEKLQPHSESYLDPFTFSAVVPLLMVRFQLYRHNINLFASPSERIAALERCQAVSMDTVRYLIRTMRTPPPSPQPAPIATSHTWREQLDAVAHNLLSRHVWRCTLILCIRGDFGSAIPCVHFLKAIGDARKLNIACGRNLAFFLDQLIQRVRQGVPQHDIEADLELLAYASGDLQGDQENAFAWMGMQTSFDASTAGPSAGLSPSEEEGLPASALLTATEMNDWGGWEYVERQISQLIEEQSRRHLVQQPSYPPPPPTQLQPLYLRSSHNETKRLQLTAAEMPNPSVATASGTSPKSGSTAPAGASRISIANII